METKVCENEKMTSVLLVDDEKEFLRILKKRFLKRGILATCVDSGSEAIALLHKRDFDAAVVDLKMEDMDGIEVLRMFKVMVPEMPVIILTGHGSEKAARQGLSMGAFDYLTKPCELDDLILKINKSISSAAGREVIQAVEA